QTMAGRQADAEDQYKLASEVEATAESNLQAKERAQTKTNAAILADKASINHTVTQLQSAEATDKGRIKTLVAQYREEAIRRAAAAEQRRLAAERAAAARAAAARAAAETTTTTVAPATTADPPPTHSSGSTSPATSPRQAPPPTTPVTTAPPATTPPPTVGVGGGGGGGGSAAQIAVNAAVGEVGVPYVWGGASPSGFDCSGLVMWAYAHAGVSLPHSSELQYADTTHISMGDLQPGDLVYPGGLYHVAMYIGGGKIVQAPYTGADVQVIPLSSFFTLASRPA
ncbi:MAG TPA: C40 family peptidase, partial [Acidimicrobiales bacterium]|nr:C40 family peptidase [Acidimicrobiales bacterium]